MRLRPFVLPTVAAGVLLAAFVHFGLQSRTVGGWSAHVQDRCLAGERVHFDAGQDAASVACAALAGRDDHVDRQLDAMPQRRAHETLAEVFPLVHAVSDAGGDSITAHIMARIADASPSNYQALYHAGLGAFEHRRDAEAEAWLRRFLDIYRADDTWTRRAREVLDQLDS